MRSLVAVSLAGLGVLVGASAGLAQVPIYDQFDEIVLGPTHPLFAPEINVYWQYRDFNQFHREYYEQEFLSKPLIYTPDLVNPFTSTVGNQAGYYRVTQTEPSAELLEAAGAE